jgi:superfamily I DNA/RNA helicase/RecB family exonuclease
MRYRLDLDVPPPVGAPTLDSSQRAVVEHVGGPLLVLAGPGTGKSTAIVESVVTRFSEGFAPAEVLVLTFGKRAAAEVRDRITSRIGGGLQPQVATFHSFAFSLMRAALPEGELPRLLSGAEEDARIRELVMGAADDASVVWPEELVGAVDTFGLASEVRAFISRMREWGITPQRLRTLARQENRPAWATIAEIAEIDARVMLLENVQDYTELLRAAVDLAEADPGLFRHRYRAIYVDEFQDTDPLQVRLLRSLVSPTTTLVAVGDPDQAIYGFRGADIRGIAEFPETFRTAQGENAPIVVLGTSRRFGPRTRIAATAVLPRGGLHAIPREVMAHHRSPQSTRSEAADRVGIERFDSESACHEHVAEEVRAAHVIDGLPWSQLAVLVRNREQLVGVQRALTRLGVPTATSADEIPLRSEPAVASILLIAQAAVRPAQITSTMATEILVGPIGHMDVAAVRRLGRALRAQQRGDGEPITSSNEAVRAALLSDDSLLTRLDSNQSEVQSAIAVHQLILAVRKDARANQPIEEILWRIWTGGSRPHGWPERLRHAALRGSASANHDIDSVMALFDSAERAAGRFNGVVGVTSFLGSLAAQHIPAEVISDRGLGGQAVRLLTVHRAKGLEFERVWLVGAQEGVWPDLRERGSALGLSALAVHAGDKAPMLAVDREERNLFYVATTRAREELTIAVVDPAEDSAEQPSRFVAELIATGAVTSDVRISGRTHRITTWDGLVARLRVVAQDPKSSRERQEAAVGLMAELATWRDTQGALLVPAADPSTWWGMENLSQSGQLISDPTSPVAFSGSSLDALLECPMKWFLENKVHAESPRGASAQFGSIVHAVAEFIAKGELLPEDAQAYVDSVWRQVPFEAGWERTRERAEAGAAIDRFLTYHREHDGQLMGTEKYLNAEIELPNSDDTVVVSGFIDRIERDESGRLLPIDLKNSRKIPGPSEIPEHGQLGIYQLLIAEDPRAWESPDNPAVPGGAALIQLRHDGAVGDGSPKVQVQEALDPAEKESWIVGKLAQAANVVRSEAFHPRSCDACRYCSFKNICPTQDRSEDLIPGEGM